MKYDFTAIEQKWQKYWEENNTFATDLWDFSKPKYYVLDMFPYPSGVGPMRFWEQFKKGLSKEGMHAR